jgi:protein-S-isoprenylcysteine O-methyltransferase Ste14
MDTPENTMTQTGVGPRWVLVSLVSCLPFVAPRLLWPEAVKIPFVPRAVAVGIGVVLLALGIPLCLAAVVRLARGFSRGELFTSGAYGLCRHPIYGSWIVFIVPGLVLFADNWVGLLAPIPMYVALRLMVRKEEAWLESTFGDAYRDYRARVRPVLPIPRFRRGRPPRVWPRSTSGSWPTSSRGS